MWKVNPFRVLYQMWMYHSSYDVERALREMLWRGMDIGRREASTCPHCDFHEKQPLIVIAPGLFACPECRQISQPLPVVRVQPRIHQPRPTILLQPADMERHTDGIELPAKTYARAREQGAGPQTASHVVAIQKKRK